MIKICNFRAESRGALRVFGHFFNIRDLRRFCFKYGCILSGNLVYLHIHTKMFLLAWHVPIQSWVDSLIGPPRDSARKCDDFLALSHNSKMRQIDHYPVFIQLDEEWPSAFLTLLNLKISIEQDMPLVIIATAKHTLTNRSKWQLSVYYAQFPEILNGLLLS